MSGRIATGPPNTGSRLRISHVVSFRPASFNGVVVDFRVRNISSEAFTVGPAFLVYFNPTSGGQLTTEDNNSVIPDTLQPGESAVVSAAFATRILTGQISVRSNDGYLAVLAATNLTRPTQ
jgi:hypothetical protein